MIEDFYFQDTTSKESLQNIAIATASGALTAGAMQASGLSQVGNAANGVNAATNTLSTTERILTNLSVGLQKAAISQSSNLLATSAIKGQSLNQTITEKGGSTSLFLNTLTQAVAEAGAKEIGYQYHGTADANGNVIHNISQSEQLALHGVLGAGISAATQTISGNDNKESLLSSALSGAAAGVIGEIVADAAYQEGRTTKTEVLNQNGEVIGFTTQPLGFSRETSIQLGSLSGSLASLATSIATGASDEQTAQNISIGSYIAGNAIMNNTFAPGAIVGGAVGATGAAATAYAEGERDPQKLLTAAAIGGTVGAVSGALMQPEGVVAGIRAGAFVGTLGGGFEGAVTTYLNNPNATSEQLFSNVAKGAFSGGISGAVSGGFSGAFATVGATTFAAESIAGMNGLAAGLLSNASTQNLFNSPTSSYSTPTLQQLQFLDPSYQPVSFPSTPVIIPNSILFPDNSK